MSNGTKIKTMKDDLLEIENKVSQSIKVPEKQQKTATLSSSSSSALPIQKPSAGFSLPKTATKSDELKTKELRNIVDRLSKKRAGITASPAGNSAPTSDPGIKTSTSEANELKDLISRISKREGDHEKPLIKPEDKEKEKLPGLKPLEKPEIKDIKLKTVEKPAEPVHLQHTSKPAQPRISTIPSEASLEKPDLDALIKPLSKPAPLIEKNADAAPKAKIVAGTASAKHPSTAQKTEEALEEKTEEIKEILDNISKKENELKDILEKMSKKKEEGTDESVSGPETTPQEKTTFSATQTIPIRESDDQEKNPYLEKLRSDENKSSAMALFTQKSSSAKKEPEIEEKPIIKKVRERLFGMEREMAQTKPVLRTAPTQIAAKENDTASADSAEENVVTKNYFKKISQEKTSAAPKIESVEEKFSDLAKDRQASGMKLEKINEFENASGIIKNGSEADEKKEIEIAKARRNYLDSQYVPATNRLVFGKQEHYSSIRKHIEERHLNADLKDLESKVATDNNISLSDKEEKRKLKARIISKYHIKSSPFFRNILIIAVIAIAIGGVALYGYLSKVIENKPPEIVAPVTIGTEIKELSEIKDSIDITTERLKNPTALRDEADKKFIADPNLRLFKLIIKDEKGNIVELKKALEGIGINPLALPQNFLESTENEYSLLFSKTPRYTTRLSMVIKLRSSETMQNAMIGWEKDRSRMRDALSPLFVSDRTSDIQNSYFQAGSYKGVNLRYLSIPDKDTAIDYFIHKNILAVATTKDDAFRFIDILTAAK